MTDIQAIIDKLEAELVEICEKDIIGGDKYNECCVLRVTDDARFNEITIILKELKKHLPKEDKSSFNILQSANTYEDDTDITFLGQLDKDKKEYYFEIIVGHKYYTTRAINVLMRKYELQAIIAALQVAYEEMDDE